MYTESAASVSPPQAAVAPAAARQIPEDRPRTVTQAAPASATPQAQLPAAAHALARLLAGMDTRLPLAKLPAPWRTIAPLIRATPAPQREAKLLGHLARHPDGEALLNAMLAVDTTLPEPASVHLGLMTARVARASKPVAARPESGARAGDPGAARSESGAATDEPGADAGDRAVVAHGPAADERGSDARGAGTADGAGTAGGTGTAGGAGMSGRVQRAPTDAHNVLLLSSRVSPVLPAVAGSPTAAAAARPPQLWPAALAPAALHGLAGEFVRTIELHTEADPAGLLVQFLVAFGNAAGRSACFVAEAQCQYTNLFSVLVGQTSKGRKGSSWGQVQRLLTAATPAWVHDHIRGGLSSGEGLINAVRDPLDDRPGVADKRLLVKEEEFAAVLRVLRRDGNTLSALLRQAWDSGTLRTLTRTDPLAATGAHISVIGHITADELRRLMSSVEAGNGFGNRFLWVCVRRARSLPEGGQPDAAALMEIAASVRQALDFACTAQELQRDEAARALWLEVYEELAAGHAGLFGALTSRAEGQVMRLALVYALLDLSGRIQRPHLEAALAVWRYCETSARCIFGDDSGNAEAELVLASLEQHPQGLTRGELVLLLQRRGGAATVSHTLALLQEQGLIERLQTFTGGRPAERWRLRPLPGSDP